MKTLAICSIIGAAMIFAALMIGKHWATKEYESNAKDQIIINGKTDEKINNYTDNDYCTRVLHGKLSDIGECE